jgi:hypothetical protein
LAVLYHVSFNTHRRVVFIVEVVGLAELACFLAVVLFAELDLVLWVWNAVESGRHVMV